MMNCVAVSVLPQAVRTQSGPRSGTHLCQAEPIDCRYLATVGGTVLEFARWMEVFGDEKLTAALLDRLIHYAHTVPMSGESYRFRSRLFKPLR